MGRKDKQHDLFYIYSVLSHPLRHKIVEILGEKDSVSFTELKNHLNVRVGTLYYHFDILRGFIAQDEKRKYMLTELGKEAYRILFSKEYQLISEKVVRHVPSKSVEYGLTRYVKAFLLPKELFPQLFDRPKLSSMGALIILLLGAWVSAQAKLEPLMLFFDQSTKPPTTLMIQFLISWLAIFSLCDLLSMLFFKRGEEHLSLLIGTAYTLLPLLLFPFLLWANDFFQINLAILRNVTFMRILLSILQGWTLVVLAWNVSMSKGLRIDRAALIGLAIAYINILILYILGYSA